MTELYVGLMSGTSMDGVDAALVEFGDASMQIRQTASNPYPDSLRETLRSAIRLPLDQDIANVTELDHAVGACFRDATISLLVDAGVDASSVAAIGSHGQTLRHRPDAERPFTLQVGNPKLIADGTGIMTIADFRSADIAAGGQGAPLAPYFHEWLFRKPGVARAIVNIGGIANVTLIDDTRPTSGFDTGPGNTLMDAWIHRHHDEAFDRDGGWAASGETDAALLGRCLADPYFRLPPPKSTGFEYFNEDWLERAGIRDLRPADVQATLCALTAQTIADAIATHAPATAEVFLCGGGVHNATLIDALSARLSGMPVATTAAAGLDPDWVEAAAFAWLAMRRLHGLPGNLPSVTGAREAVLLGSIHAPA